MRDDKSRLRDILKECGRIKDNVSHYGNDRDIFMGSWRYQDNIIVNLERIGESAGNISDILKEEYPGVDWSGIIGMRVTLAHHYWRTDPAILWEVIEYDIPILLVQIQKILEKMEQDRL
ncbi:MAG: DUF86 domain-containing protein [Methanomassiliicoccaceae archaeon]|nr:DUF86 domain-containing protein [Methanomassiliicoccaceae archaeon]